MYLTMDMLLRAGYQLKETFPPAHVGVILKAQLRKKLAWPAEKAP